MKDDAFYIREAIKEAEKGMESNEGGPFGAIIVKDGEIIARGNNKVTSLNDPTAHAEILAIRQAAKSINSFMLTGCTIYSSCEPCPMCMGAVYWSRADRIVFAASREDAAKAGFDDSHIYHELKRNISDRKLKTSQVLREESVNVLVKWKKKEDKTEY